MLRSRTGVSQDVSGDTVAVCALEVGRPAERVRDKARIAAVTAEVTVALRKLAPERLACLGLAVGCAGLAVTYAVCQLVMSRHREDASEEADEDADGVRGQEVER